jgi:endo-1,4-beta-xylanase
MNRFLVCALFLSTALAAAEAPVVPLWPSGAPGSETYAGQPEKYLEKDDHITRVYNIHNPSITVYLPHVNRAAGVGVVVAPGGAHQYLAVGIEGEEIAHRLNAAGVAVFVLKYRLSRSEGSTYTIEGHSFPDAQRALRVVRSRAKEWRVDPGRIGIMGFSAGGALVGLAGTKFDAGNPAASDPVERLSSRPDFLVFGYTGGKVDPKTIMKDTPPSFLISAADDRGPTANNLALFGALTEAGVPAEIHVYSRGGHGFGFLGRSPEFLKWPVSGWPDQLLAWLADLGILKR